MTTIPLTTNFQLQELYPGQAQKDVVVNTDLVAIDTLLQPVVVNQLNTPPSPSTDQVMYIVGTAPTGVWATHANALALWQQNGSFWQFFTPQYGWTVFNQTQNSLWTFNGTAWGITPVNVLSTGIAQFNVVSLGLNTPPGSPANGATYIVGLSPTGAWVGQANALATWNAGISSWVFLTPQTGWTAYDQQNNTLYAWSGTTWTPVQTSNTNAMMLALIFGG